jgi:hypothetical protein
MDEWIALHLKPTNVVPNKQHDGEARHITIKTDVYQLPLDVIFHDLHGKSVKRIAKPSSESETVDRPTFEDNRDIKYAKGLKGLTCLTCGLVFPSHIEQQQHFSSDYHLFNLKRSLKKKPCVSIEEYSDLMEQKAARKGKDNGHNEDGIENSDNEEEEEGGGGEEGESESNESSEEEESNDLDDELMNGSDLSYRYEYEDSCGKVKKVFQNNSVGPVFRILRNNCLPWHFSLSLALFHNNSRFAGREWNQTFSDGQSFWQDLYHQLHYLRSNPIMTVFILRSGKFAGAVFDNNRALANRNQSPLLIHKVIRRYTVRAKAGGGQSSHDNKGSKAKSMGAQLRRYGEKALKEDIQNILTLWQGYIESSGLILIATTKRMRSILFEKDAAEAGSGSVVLLKKDDPRIANVPFIVDRPTLESADMIRERVLQVVVSSEDLPAAQESSLPPPPTKSALKKEKLPAVQPSTIVHPEKTLAQENVVDCPLSQALVAACLEANDERAKLKVQQVLEKFQKEEPTTGADVDEDDVEISYSEAYCDGWKLSMVINLPMSLQELETPLHIAATKNHIQTAITLLTHGADPERLDIRGRTPYYLAQTKEMRDAFRKVRAELGEARWNWSKAGVPEPLTDERIAQQKQKEKEKKKRAQQRKKDQKARVEQEEKDRQLAQKLQEELRLKEQQDFEAKQKNKAGACEFCNKSLYKTDFFEALGKKCCSTDCVAKLRRKLVADAAIARLAPK